MLYNIFINIIHQHSKSDEFLSTLKKCIFLIPALFSSLLKSGSGGGTSVVNGVRALGSLPGEVSGALAWPVIAQDEGRARTPTECFLGLSRDTFVLIEESSRQIVFVAPTKAILGKFYFNWLIEFGKI